MSKANAYIALGSNIGDRRAEIESALSALDEMNGVVVVAVSDLIETAPQGPVGQPRYFNAAAALSTALEPHRLLEAMAAVEAAHGRDRRREQRWGPRLIDLDLLLYEDRVIDSPGLTVPHPRMHLRTFVLGPLAQVAPSVVHPVLGVTIECLRDRLASRSSTEYQPTAACSGE
ncbi:MAG: 2-amino-4-hydroxy-6-hydroxymethyldihydropteridine diphosphokinase [Planctomycetota bacterium]|nr:2-amino-4-hydroxy-6-hydroxymethyldihydropteridine diphosphokinase [Planctomycetota bacterium]MCZ6492850.1 2-amino-4-hydroxy-6-hydroxymethyldihydropteridine diphosphokinase [Planctomycetota bacterium]MCZ6851673.1 2-amino-4-hydroxy-6-hydroxymethyldihydropteridine diphosphokinase [Planctomycetota bacterium]